MLFVVKMEVDSAPQEIAYDSIDSCLHDEGLRALFEDQLVSKCVVFSGDKRLTSIPVMTWERFKDQLISNSTTILRGASD